MKVKDLRALLTGLSDDATVTVNIDGALMELDSAMHTDRHDAEYLPRVIIDVTGPYRFRETTPLT